MHQPRSFYRSQRNGIRYPLALAALFLASACAPDTASTLYGVGCADPFCNKVMPETRKVLGCVGKACNEPPQPSAAKEVANTATEGSSSAPQPATTSGADSPARSAGETDEVASSLPKLKVYYESHRRP